VKSALESLSDAYRLAVLLADVEGFSYKEIAGILDVPIGTVMSRLHRGRKALQRALYDLAVERGLLAGSETNTDTGSLVAVGAVDGGRRDAVESGEAADG